MKSCMISVLPFALVVYCLVLPYTHVIADQCSKFPTPLSSHAFRYELLSSKNQTRINEVYSHNNHLPPTDGSTWSDSRPRRTLKEEDKYKWSMIYRKMKYTKNEATNLLQEVSLHDVRLDPESMHAEAQKTNLDYLLMFNVDSLVWSFRKTAGLATPGKVYGGWESPDVELRGHFVGHYMSASAQMWASTHNDSLKEKMFAVVSVLSTCPEKLGSGYLSAFPSEFFDRVEALKGVWAPYYTIHKIMAGLLDQHLLADNPQALKMLTWMVDYFYNRVQNVIVNYGIERHWQSLNEEFGGMNDILYKLYTVMPDSKHLVLAHLFDKPCFLAMLALKIDDISGIHANTHIPIVVGAQMRYEATGDPVYEEMGEFFMNIVNSSHAYATGGTSDGELWRWARIKYRRIMYYLQYAQGVTTSVSMDERYEICRLL